MVEYKEYDAKLIAIATEAIHSLLIENIELKEKIQELENEIKSMKENTKYSGYYN